MLLYASMVYALHHELAANGDYVLKQIWEKVNTINGVAQGSNPQPTSGSYDAPGELETALDEFYVSIESKQFCFSLFVNFYNPMICLIINSNLLHT